MPSLVSWFVVGFAVQALVALGLFLWGRWVARRLGGRRWRRAAWLPAAALVLNLVSATATASLVRRAGTTPGLLGPEGRVAWRAQRAGAGAVVLGSAALAALLYGTGIVVNVVGTLRIRARSKAARLASQG